MFKPVLRIGENVKRRGGSDMDEIKKVLILVEMGDGKVRQVLADSELKRAYLHLLQKEGSLRVTEEVMPIELEFKK